MLSRMDPSLPPAMRTLHLLKTPDTLLANDNRLLGRYHLIRPFTPRCFKRQLDPSRDLSAHHASAKQLKTRVIEADGVALFLSCWTLWKGRQSKLFAPNFRRNDSIPEAAGGKLEGADRQFFRSVSLGPE
jgi:hypothetical protein